MTRRPCAEFRDGLHQPGRHLLPVERRPVARDRDHPRPAADPEGHARSCPSRSPRKGAVVFNVDYRGVRPVSKGFPEAISDVACAVRYARQFGPRYGGDRDHLVLVGHSMGGYVGAMVSLAGDTFPGGGGSCKSTLGMRASLPNGFVSVAGVSAIHRDYRIDQTFLGGTYAADPEGLEARDAVHPHRSQGRQQPPTQGGHHLRAPRPVHEHRARDPPARARCVRRATTATSCCWTRARPISTSWTRTSTSDGAWSGSCGRSSARPTPTDA